MRDVIQRTVDQNLLAITAGRTPPNPSELLSSERMKTLLTNLQHGPFDWIVIDTPPVLAVTDAVILAPAVAGVTFVVGAEMTRRRLAERALETILESHPKMVGVVLNKVDFARNKYYYSHTTGAMQSYYAEAVWPRRRNRAASDGRLGSSRCGRVSLDSRPGVAGAIASAVIVRPSVLRSPFRMLDAALVASARHRGTAHSASDKHRASLSPAAGRIEVVSCSMLLQVRDHEPGSRRPCGARVRSVAGADLLECAFAVCAWRRRADRGPAGLGGSVSLAVVMFLQRSITPGLIYGFWTPITRASPTPLGPFVNPTTSPPG